MLKEQSNKELTDEELDAVAGGCNTATEYEAIYSTITAGLLCVGWALDSATYGYVGQKDAEKDGRLCNMYTALNLVLKAWHDFLAVS